MQIASFHISASEQRTAVPAAVAGFGLEDATERLATSHRGIAEGSHKSYMIIELIIEPYQLF